MLFAPNPLSSLYVRQAALVATIGLWAGALGASHSIAAYAALWHRPLPTEHGRGLEARR